jgi:signal transduction histidine kinase
MERTLRWIRTEPGIRLLDAGLVLAVLAVGVAGMVAARTNPEIEAAPPSPALVGLSAAAAVALWWRRDHPFIVLGTVTWAVVVAAAIREPGLYAGQIGLELVIVMFAIGAWARSLWGSVALAAVALLSLYAGSVDDGNGVLAASAFSLALVGLPLVVGYAARSRRLYVEEVERRLVEAERDRDARARHALEVERSRIARELHDVVAHHVSLIGVQAGAARTALDASPETTRDALAAIEASSRDAVAEMRQLLDVLRPLDDEPAAAPQPGLTALDELLGRWRAAGFTITCDAQGTPTELPPALSLTCYRIVEESLTNVSRHTRARQAHVAIAIDPDAVRIRVSDPGPPVMQPTGRHSGRGLVGMAERVALHGGDLRTGPTGDGGFAVDVRLPRVAA